MEKLKSEYTLSDGRVVDTTFLLFTLVNPNEFYSKSFKSKFTKKQDVINEIYNRWLEEENEYSFVLDKNEIKDVPVHVKKEIITLFEKLISYFEKNYIKLPKSLNFDFKLPNNKTLESDKFAPSFDFFYNHMFSHSYQDKKIIIAKIFEFILKNKNDIILEEPNVTTNRRCLHCGNEDNNHITCFRFYFSDANGKSKNLKYIKNKYIEVINDDFVKYCNHRKDWIEYVGESESQEIGDFLIIDFCEKCSHWSIDDEEIEENEYEDEDEYEDIKNRDYEEKYLNRVTIINQKNVNNLSFPFLKHKEKCIKISPLEIFLWETKENEIILESAENARVDYGNKITKIGLASLRNMGSRIWLFPLFFKVKEGVFLRNGYREIWHLEKQDFLYFPHLKVIKVKNTSKNKEYYHGPKLGNIKSLRWVVYFEIEGKEFKVGVDFLPKHNIWKLYSYPKKHSEGICPYCSVDCSSYSLKGSVCNTLNNKLFHGVILNEIKNDISFINETKKLIESELTDEEEKEEEIIIKNIRLNKYEYIEYHNEPKWDVSFSYELFKNGKKLKRKSRSYFTKNDWNIIISGDLNKNIKEQIKSILISSKELEEFVENVVKEKEKNEERPQIEVLKVKKTKNKIADDVEIEFIIDFKIKYENDQIVCTYERYKYLNIDKTRDYYDSKNDKVIRKTFLEFDKYIYEELRKNSIVIEKLGEI